MNSNHAIVQAGVAVSVALGVVVMYRNRSIPERRIAGGDGPLSVSGLRNVGNTCFINAVLQSLASLPPFVEYLKTLSPPADGPERPFTMELFRLMDKLRPIRPLLPLAPLNPRNLQGLLAEKVERFANFDQQDAQELFQMVMQLVSEEAVPKSAGDDEEDAGLHRSAASRWNQTLDGFWGCHGLLYQVPPDGDPEDAGSRHRSHRGNDVEPALANPLRGTLVFTTRCAECGQTSSRAEPFVDLSLTLPEARALSAEYTGKGISLGNSARARAVDLDTVLSEYTREELVEGAECSKCSKLGRVPVRRGAYKNTLLGRPPETLCLHFPRRHQSPHGLMMKLEQHVKFPLQLDVTRFCYAGGDRAEDIAAPHISRGTAHSAGLSPGARKPGAYTSNESAWPSPPAKVSSAHEQRVMRSQHVRADKNHALLGGSAEGAMALDGRKRVDGLTLKRAMAIGGSTASSIVSGNSSAVSGSVGREGVEYDLRAVIVHDGGADAGHYKAFRNLGSGAEPKKAMKETRPAPDMLEQTRRVLRRSSSMSDAYEGRWVSLSDETVQAVSAREVLASQAYMLFYKRIARASYLELG